MDKVELDTLACELGDSLVRPTPEMSSGEHRRERELYDVVPTHLRSWAYLKAREKKEEQNQ